MDLEPQNIFSYIAEQQSSNNNHKCLRVLITLNKILTTEQIGSSVLEKYLLYMFDKRNGLFSFIQSVMEKRNFDETIIQSIEIISVFINNFSDKLENYILVVNENCLKILLSNTSANVKVKTAEVLLLSLIKINKYNGNEHAYREIFKKILQQCDTHTDTVKSKEYEILGVFAEHYTYLIDDERETINLHFFTSRIAKLAKSKQSVLAGLFAGLEYYCNGFTINNIADNLHLKNLYKEIKNLSNAKADGTVRKANRAAMHFFGKHMKLFIVYIIEENNWKNWHKRIYKDWFNLGVDDRKVAEYTLIQFFLCMSESLLDMTEDSCLPILKHFVTWSENVFMEPIKNIKFGLQCLRYFSEPLNKHDYKEFKRIFLIIMQHFEKCYIFNEYVSSESNDILPDYIQCIPSFIRFHNITTVDFHSLQRAIINMIKHFHVVKPLYHFCVINSTIDSFLYLKNTKYFKNYVKHVIYHGIIWSCSHQHILDSESSEGTKVVTVKDYFPFWRGLLNMTPKMCNTNFHEMRYILSCIVQELINTLMILTVKLNINMKLSETPYTQIETSYKLEQENDYAIFLNVIDLYEDILDHTDPQMLKTCICNLIMSIIKKCSKFQLVSGFYKLLSLMLKIANNLDIFTEENEKIDNCKENLMNFVGKLIQKMKQFKDELFISCLRVLVETPALLIEPFLDECIGLFKTIFELGTSYIPLASLGLTALERWQKVIAKENFDNFLVEIVPYLDSYLRSVSLGHLTKADYKTKSRKTVQKLNKRKILLEIEAELLKFQKRILNFIGCQDTKICQAFTLTDRNMERRVTSANYHLKLSLPYEDHTLDIYLEPFTMRIIELSLHCSDRKSRLIACEVLQGITMIFLGKTVSVQDTLHSDLEPLWKSICTALLQLACDVDETVKQIFQPLFYQLIHWYTSQSKRETKHSAVLIDVLMDGITHSRNASLRDFSGSCFKEFVKWTIKQSKLKDLERDPLYIKILVKKIRYFSTLPDATKKLGASLIFNNIYQEFREVPSLVSIFSIELLHIFLTSLTLVDDTSNEEDFIIPQIKKSILNLQRIFEESAPIFVTQSPRRIPSVIGNNDMNDVLKWIFVMTGNTSQIVRSISMNLFIKIAPIYIKENVIAQFVQTNFQNAITIYGEQLEDNPSSIIKWLQTFLRLLDGYIFIIKNSLSSIDLSNKNSSIYNSIRRFSSEVLPASYEGKHKQQYLTLISSCSLAVLKLSATLLENLDMLNTSESFWNDNIWIVIINYTFEADYLNDEYINTDYKNTLAKFLNSISKTSNISDDFVKKIRNYIQKRFSEEIIVNLKGPISRKFRILLKGLIMIQRSEMEMHFKSESFSGGVANKIMNLYLEYKDDNVIFVWELSDSVTEYIKLMLELASSNINELQILFTHLRSDITVSYSKSASNELFGIYLLKTFDGVLTQNVIKHFNLFLESYENMEQLTKLTIYIIDYINEHNLQTNFPYFSKSILDGWTVFQSYFDQSDMNLGLMFVIHFYKAFGDNLDINDHTILNWAMRLTINDSHTQDQFTLRMDILYIVVSTRTHSEETTMLIRTLIKKIENEVDSKENSSTKRIIIEKMLPILPQIKNNIIFEYFVDTYDQDDHEQELASSLETFMSNNNINHQSIMSITYKIIKNENNFKKKVLLTKMFLYLILIYSNYTDCVWFLTQHINTALEENFSDYGSGIVALLFIEILFLKTPSHILEDDQLLKQQFGVSNLLKQGLKIALDAFKITENADRMEHLRQYKCSAYKALVSIVTNCNKASLFHSKLFIRQENNCDILWKAVIDTNIVYIFSIDFDSYPTKTKKLISIKKNKEEINNKEENTILRYIESPMLFNSSLSQDVTRYDFTSTILKHNKCNVSNEDTFQQGVVYLESTDLNKHELMATVCGLIEDIFKKGISKLPIQHEEFVEIPVWMEGIRKLLLDLSTHKNVKLFWIKVIQNENSIFKHFARYFITPLLQFLIDKVAGDDLNYYVTDVVEILVEWSKDVTLNEENATLASMVLEILIDMLVNERSDVYKNNLRLIDCLVKYWKGVVKLPHMSVAKRMSEAVDQEIKVGLHLCSIFLINGVSPCGELEIVNFWKKLYEILSQSNTAVLKMCAEVVGLMLNYQKCHENIDQISDEVTKILLKYDDNKYANTLEGIVAHYPDILDNRHFVALFNKLHNSNCTLQTTFLRIIFQGAEHLSEYTDFANESWCTYLKSQHDEVRLLTLEIMLKTFNIIQEENLFLDIIKTIRGSLFYANGVFRVRTFTLMMDAYKQVKRNDIKEICREVLVQGLSDNNIEIRDKIWQFWEDNENVFVPANVLEKFIYLMDKFYIPKVEEYFLGNVSYYLLSSLKHDEMDKPLFDNPLQDCKFEDYELTTDWKLQHQSVVPMFAKTAKSFSVSSSTSSSSSFDYNRIRATPTTLAFTPTQNPAWDKYLFDVTSLNSNILKENNEFLGPSQIQSTEDFQQKTIHKRFLKDKSKTAEYFANKATIEKIQKQEKRYQTVKERENKVTLYRNYRIGDLPDIQITLKSIIKPLRMLILHDGEIANLFISFIFNAMLKQIRDDDGHFVERLFNCIKSIFRNSLHFNNTLFSALLDILLLSKDYCRMESHLLTSVCQQSGLLSLGTLLLEDYVVILDAEPIGPKRGILAQDVKMECWVKLAELYKDMQEWDMVKTIFIEKTNCNESIQQALLFESEKKWPSAYDSYMELLKTDLVPERQDFYFESCFKCLANLGEWETLPKSVKSIIPEDNGNIWDVLWTTNWYQQKILPWYIEAHVKSALFSEKGQEEFMENINKSLEDPYQGDYLRNTFCEELCILWLINNDISQARDLLKDSLDNFLKEWQLINPLFENMRFNKILGLRQIVDIGRFIDTELKLSKNTDECNIMDLIRYWERTQREYLPSVTMSESKLLYRKLFINFLLAKIHCFPNNNELREALENIKLFLDISFMNMAVDEGNFWIAKKYAKKYSSQTNSDLMLIYGNICYLSSQLVSSDKIVYTVEKMLNALHKFKVTYENGHQPLKSMLRFFDISLQLTDILTQNPKIFQDIQQSFRELFGEHNMLPSEIAMAKLKELTITESQNSAFELEDIQKALVRLAYYVQNKDNQKLDFVLYVLRAMRLGSKEGRQLFPCLLLENELENTLINVFVEETKTIPTWMFLGWIPQLLAIVNSNKVLAISEIILRIANTYPQAIMYAYRLSKDNYQFTDCLEQDEVDSLLEKLDALLLTNSIIDTFLEALANVTDILRLHQIYSGIRSCDKMQDVLVLRDRALQERQKFSEHLKDLPKHVRSLFDVLNKIDQSLSVTDIQRMCKKVTLSESIMKGGPLTNYSPWLANFSAARINIQLEIPGQYLGDKIPLAEHHIKIARFGENVTVMESKQKPVKFTMIGNNGKSYSFLIKSGEDIRQDQRIQQLFNLMNSIFTSDNKRYNLLTYQVIPLRSTLGLIQWVEDIISFQKLIERAMDKKKFANILNKAKEKYLKHFENVISGNVAQETVIKAYQEIVYSIPMDIFRKSIWSLCVTTENFIAFRNNFIRSYSVMCICHWLLGVGDRHLENNQVSLTNGMVLGIDFGHAFGTATQYLAVPELIPFRLTPHIVELMLPLKERGAFRNVFINCLKSLRNSQDSLLATMNVFVQEFQVEWVKQSLSHSPNNWYPTHKINQARRKLKGAPSRSIVIEDLKSNQKAKPEVIQASIVAVATANSSSMDYVTLTVEQQVDALIEHALDPNILGRTFFGWLPYV